MEDIIYAIVNEASNAEECKAKIREYEEQNKASIVIRQSQRADEERSIQDRIAAEQREVERRKRELEEEEKAIALTKRKFKQESTEVLLGVSNGEGEKKQNNLRMIRLSLVSSSDHIFVIILLIAKYYSF